MRAKEPFRDDDLFEFGQLLERADEVVAMREIAGGEHDPLVIGLRHDVDNTLDATVELARWEHAHGWRSTYFILHDSPYWNAPHLHSVLDEITILGHEIGIHANAIATALTTGEEPAMILDRALDRLRRWGYDIIGVAAHGDSLCRTKGGKLRFVNDEMFVECARPEAGEPEREIIYHGVTVKLDPRPLADFGLKYDAYRAGPRAMYLSDSNGEWNEWLDVNERFPSPFGQLHILQHPCWWVEAFAREEARA